MNKTIQTQADLLRIKETYQKKLQNYEKNVLVCGGAGCISSDCKLVMQALCSEVEKLGLNSKINIMETGCMGICAEGPVMLVLPEGVFYVRLDEKSAREIARRHLGEGETVEKYTFFDENLKQHIPLLNNIEFFREQTKVVLENCGAIDYADIRAYIAQDGYLAAAQALADGSSEKVIEEVTASGLRGRGGAGFPTGVKLRTGHDQQSDIKYMVCNADEGDPGAFMDRSIIEGDPHSVIEGMILAAYAIGAEMGFVYIRAEYPLAIDRLQEAIDQARTYNLLGENLFLSGFSFDLEIRIGAGAFVCGEETALLASIEGNRGEPSQKPPYPFEDGLYGKPTIIDNVETLANLPVIIRRGSAWFRQIGTKEAPGTKVFALAGDVLNTGIIEVPIGTSIGDIIYKIGGGLKDKKEFKAAQIGGPSGGCITKENLNTPTDYESLSKLGAIMGSGGLIVMNEDACMVDTARFFMDFICDESCGKCAACRIGTKRMQEILERITTGQGVLSDIDLLEAIGETLQQTALCGLGQTAPNPILSTIHNFRDEYEEHISMKYCRAGVCADLFISPCENTCPAGVNVPGYISLVAAGRFMDAYNLILQENPFPAVCGRICTRPCETKCRRRTVDEAIAIRDLKRFVADYAFSHEQPYSMQLVVPKNGKHVGVVGGGASGLTCAYYLTRIGYDVDVLESEQVAGGVLAFGIPEYRLPKDILQHEIGLIEQAGVNILLGKEVGKELDFATLRDHYDALYVATGTQYPQKINIPGEDLPGVFHGIDFLKSVHMGETKELSGHVVVIGGGNTAVDSARTALRLGADEVTILYRRTIDNMPAYEEEVHDALLEGVQILELASPVRILGDARQGATGIECVRMEPAHFDSSGRRKSNEIKGSEFVVQADLVIPAVSQYADLPFIGDGEIARSKWGTFLVDNLTLMSSMDGVFAGGDVTRGPDEVIRAIADGKQAAISIDKYLGGDGILNKGEPIEIPVIEEDSDVVYHEQFKPEMLSFDERRDNMEEVVQGYHRINAIAESMRCLHCDRR